MKGKIISWVLWLCSIALLLYCSYAVYIGYDFWIWFAFTLVLVLSVWISSLLHELGHMLFGALVKIKAVPKFTGWRKFLDAMSCTVKPQTAQNLKSRIIFTTLGGLFVNFLFIALGIVALCVPAVPTYLSAFLPSSLYLFILNALPLYLNGGKTDGLVIYELAREEDAAKVLLSVLTVQAQVLNGKPIEEVDESLLFGVPQIREDDPAFIALCELRYEYYKAVGEEEKAQAYKSRFEELKEEYT